SVAELAERIKALEEEFGVSAAAVAAAAPAAGGGGGDGAAAEEESTTVDVVLTGPGDKKIQVIKVVRAATGLGLKEAKALVDEDPVAFAQVKLPPGRVSPDTPLGTVWIGPRSRGAGVGCVPRTLVFGIAATKPVLARRRDFKRGTMRRARTTLTLTGAGLAAPRRVSAQRTVGRDKTLGALIGTLHVRLPDDILPLYPRRELYVGALDSSGVEQTDVCPRA